MNEARIVHMLVSGSEPPMARYVGISPETTGAELAMIVDAVFDFRGSRLGSFSTESGLYPATDLTDTTALDSLWATDEIVAYRPARGDWKVNLVSLSSTRLPIPLPTLIDSTGPDACPTLDSAYEMRVALEDLRMASALVPLPKESEDRLTGAFQNFNARQIQLKLTESFQPQIAERLAAAMQGSTTSVEDLPPLDLTPEPEVSTGFSTRAQPWGIGIDEDEEWEWESQQASVIDLHLAEVDERYPSLEELRLTLDSSIRLSPDSAALIGHRVSALLKAIAPVTVLNSSGNLKVKDVIRVQELCGGTLSGGNPDKPSQGRVIGLSQALTLLEDADLITRSKTRMRMEPRAHELMDKPEELARLVAGAVPSKREEDYAAVAIL